MSNQEKSSSSTENSCRQCGAGPFTNKSNRNRHEKLTHGSKVKCQICNKGIQATSQNLKVHIKKHLEKKEIELTSLQQYCSSFVAISQMEDTDVSV